MTQEPLLRCERATFRESNGGDVTLPDLVSSGDRIGLVGAWQPLFRFLAGELELAEGEVLIAGEERSSSLRCGRTGIARCAQPWPLAWQVGEYLEAGAELAGLNRNAARQASGQALGALGLERMLQLKLAALTLHEGRAIRIAQAIITEPATLFVESPFEQLDYTSCYWVLEVIRRASHGRRLVVSFEHMPVLAPEHSLLHGMEQVFVLDGGELDVRSSSHLNVPSARRYRINLGEFASELTSTMAEVGWILEPCPSSFRETARWSNGFVQGSRAWIAEMPEAGTVRDHLDWLLRCALVQRAIILELTPITRSGS